MAVVDKLATPIRIISFPIREVKKILYYHRTFDEYLRLRQETNLLKRRITSVDEVILENVRLLNLLDLKKKLLHSSIAAQVVGREPSNWNSSLLIDKGERDGIKKGMPVVNGLGVIGRINDVGENTSKIILLTDPQFSVAALVQRGRENGLVSGTLRGICRMTYVDENTHIQVGDKIITSKLSTAFPEGLMIGQVIEVNENPKLASKEIFIQPSVLFSQIEEVLVLSEEK